MPFAPHLNKIIIGSRDSPLARKQVEEVEAELRLHFPQISFCPIFVKTTGDHDKKTSLRTLDRTDFFTKEIDYMVLNKICRVGIHSAKDLPDPLTKGLSLVALTQGVDPSDSLVMREGDTLMSLPSESCIATSSVRREETVRQLRKDLIFVDIRGTIGERLDKLLTHVVDGVVIAEAALIRLGLTHLNRFKLPGETVPLQGRLAVVARSDDQEMAHLFQVLHR